MERPGLNKATNCLKCGKTSDLKCVIGVVLCGQIESRNLGRVQSISTRGGLKTINSAFCTCNSAFRVFCQVVYEDILLFDSSRIYIFLKNEEMTKYIACTFIQYIIDDCNFHSFNIQKYCYFIRGLDLTEYKIFTCTGNILRLNTSRALCKF